MPVYIALLRGINVGGKNIIKMADLQALCNSLKFEQVSTYIQSGNIVFKCKEKSKDKIKQQLEVGIQHQFNLDVQVVIKTATDIKSAIENYPYSYNAADKIVQAYISFAHNKINDASSSFPKEKYLQDEISIDKENIYYFYPNGAGSSKLSNNVVEKIYGQPFTQRNINTCIKLVQMADASI
jgi:uncharacterized protein (DUF1697 family)